MDAGSGQGEGEKRRGGELPSCEEHRGRVFVAVFGDSPGARQERVGRSFECGNHGNHPAAKPNPAVDLVDGIVQVILAAQDRAAELENRSGGGGGRIRRVG